MAKIAVEFGSLRDTGIAPPHLRQLAAGRGWTVSDVICNAGPHNRPFEEQHAHRSVAVVVSGSFQYRSSSGCDVMTPGALLLANKGDCFCCGHEHGVGDHCISFTFTSDFLDQAVETEESFPVPRIPPIRLIARAVARASAFLAGDRSISPEELSIQIAAQAAAIARGQPAHGSYPEASSIARVSRVIRMIENDREAPLDLTSLARAARLSPHHFLRTFESITGATPHQYILRTRLRSAAIRLKTEPARILDIALDCGFGDVSNFNRAFRAEFGMSPRQYRTLE